MSALFVSETDEAGKGDFEEVIRQGLRAQINSLKRAIRVAIRMPENHDEPDLHYDFIAAATREIRALERQAV